MADICDLASEAEAQHLAAALSVATATAGRGPIWQGGKAYCRECGEAIAEARVTSVPYAELCIDCAREKEE